MPGTFNVNCRIHELCEFIEESGGTVELDNKQFNKFSHVVWDVWEDGFQNAKTIPVTRETEEKGKR